ncbi:hypothetical protein Scep_011402 [Stephania cephalantha]|uniref:Uncharacterized protein n=1 Tax=Stephania cephalantha TaxID=152367 RepID=A0AAP0P6F6_9MAGN
MPVIGFYVAGASLVFANVRDGYRVVSFHSIQSLLTLFGIAAKLPVDLSTWMPSAQGQLSKLTGTALICICMGFFMPSIGSTTESECTANLASLSIFVITVVVNICIQMRIGVINLFFLRCLGTTIRFLSLAKYLQTVVVWSGSFHSVEDLLAFIVMFPVSAIFYLASSFVVVVGLPTIVLLWGAYTLIPDPKELFREEEGSNDEACFCICKPKDEDEVHDDDHEDEEVTKEYKRLISDQGLSLDHWILKKSGRDLKRWINMS